MSHLHAFNGSGAAQEERVSASSLMPRTTAATLPIDRCNLSRAKDVGMGMVLSGRGHDAEDVGMSMVLSGRGHDVALENTKLEDLECIGSERLLYEAAIGTKWIFEGYVIEYNAGGGNSISSTDMSPPPSQSPLKRSRGDGATEKKAVHVLAGDNSGPVMITLWE